MTEVKPEKPTKKEKQRASYKKMIGRLAYRVSRGEFGAERELNVQREKTRLAEILLTEVINDGNIEQYAPIETSGSLKAPDMPVYHGSAYRPWSGGLPSLGKKQ